MNAEQQVNPWWVLPILGLLTAGIVGGVTAAFVFDNLGFLLIAVISFCILYAG